MNVHQFVTVELYILHLCLSLCLLQDPLTEQLGLKNTNRLDLLQYGSQSWEELAHNLTTPDADEAVGRRLVGGEPLKQALPLVQAVEGCLKQRIWYI